MSIGQHNPGNIRTSKIPWQGKGDPVHGFETFIAPEYGLRAMAKILLNYYFIYKLHTIRAIISRWAPPSENDTEAYIDDVCDRCAINPQEDIQLDTHIPFAEQTMLIDLIKAITHHENGSQPYDCGVIVKAIEMAEG